MRKKASRTKRKRIVSFRFGMGGRKGGGKGVPPVMSPEDHIHSSSKHCECGLHIQKIHRNYSSTSCDGDNIFENVEK